MQIKVAMRAVESLLNRHDELRSTDSGTKQAFILKVKVLLLVVTHVFFSPHVGLRTETAKPKWFYCLCNPPLGV